jgi:electron transfer flavoprotein beta subunit
MHVVVCVKVVPKTEDVTLDPATKTLDRSKAQNEINQADKNALEAALKLKDKHDVKVTVLSMGPPLFEAFLKTAIAMGADDAILVSDRAFAGADTFPTSLTLAAAIRKIGDVDIVLCGEESSDASTGQLPSSIAEWLGFSQATYVSSFEIAEGGPVRARRTIKSGYEVVEANLPCLMSVELGVNSPRFPDFRRKRWAENEFKTTVWTLTDLGLAEDEVGLKGSRTVVEELVEGRKPERKRQFLQGTAREQADQIVRLLHSTKVLA